MGWPQNVFNVQEYEVVSPSIRRYGSLLVLEAYFLYMGALVLLRDEFRDAGINDSEIRPIGLFGSDLIPNEVRNEFDAYKEPVSSGTETSNRMSYSQWLQRYPGADGEHFYHPSALVLSLFV
jgi:hypothetical protein